MGARMRLIYNSWALLSPISLSSFLFLLVFLHSCFTSLILFIYTESRESCGLGISCRSHPYTRSSDFRWQCAIKFHRFSPSLRLYIYVQYNIYIMYSLLYQASCPGLCCFALWLYTYYKHEAISITVGSYSAVITFSLQQKSSIYIYIIVDGGADRRGKSPRNGRIN